MVNIRTARTALYRFYDSDDVLLYVGITNMTQVRWAAHTAKPWWKQVTRKEVKWFDNRAAAAQAEVLAIRLEEPRYNVANAWYANPKPVVPSQPTAFCSRPTPAVPADADEVERKLAAAAAEWRRSKKELDEANAKLRALLVLGRAAGKGPSHMAKLTGFTREWVAKIAPGPSKPS